MYTETSKFQSWTPRGEVGPSTVFPGAFAASGPCGPRGHTWRTLASDRKDSKNKVFQELGESLASFHPFQPVMVVKVDQ